MSTSTDTAELLKPLVTSPENQCNQRRQAPKPSPLLQQSWPPRHSLGAPVPWCWEML